MLTLLLVFAAGSINALPNNNRQGQEWTEALHCQDLISSLEVSATVRQFPANFDPVTFNYSTVPSLPDQNITGTYNIASSFCEPFRPHWHHSDTLHIVVHGLTYSRTYWSGLAIPPLSYAPVTNSYVEFAARRGYPTLAIDRLCNGLSTHPKDDNACQIENQVAVIKAIVDLARSSTTFGHRFSRIILVGHSFGSSTVATFVRLHPEDADDIVLTGFGLTAASSAEAAVADALFGLPTANTLHYPDLDNNYLEIANRTMFNEFFYAGSYNHTVFEHDFNTTGTFNLFEPATTSLAQLTTDFAGGVIVLDGELDALTCPGGRCGYGQSSPAYKAIEFYPGAAFFTAYNVRQTGHDVNLHNSAHKAYTLIFDELERQERLR